MVNPMVTPPLSLLPLMLPYGRIIASIFSQPCMPAVGTHKCVRAAIQPNHAGAGSPNISAIRGNWYARAKNNTILGLRARTHLCIGIRGMLARTHLCIGIRGMLARTHLCIGIRGMLARTHLCVPTEPTTRCRRGRKYASEQPTCESGKIKTRKYFHLAPQNASIFIELITFKWTILI